MKTAGKSHVIDGAIHDIERKFKLRSIVCSLINMIHVRKCDAKLVGSLIPRARAISTSGAKDQNITFLNAKEETASVKRARLLYQSRKRGMLENGLLLSSFAKKYLDTFSDNHLHQYDCLINLPSNDWDIYYWAVGVQPIPPELNNEVMKLLQEYIKNEKRECRIVQPDLH